MNKKYLYLFSALIGVLIIAGAFGLSSRTTTAPTAGLQSTAVVAPLTALDPLFDFGTISMAAGKVSHVFVVKNTGQTAITITKMYTSCMCTVATLVTLSDRRGPFGMPGMVGYEIPDIHEVLAPGEEARVEVTFDPAAHGPAGVGKLHRIIYLETGQGSDNALQLSFDATVTL